MSIPDSSPVASAHPDRTLSDHLNQNCYCIGTDPHAVHSRLCDLQNAHGLTVRDTPLFSALPVFVSEDEVRAMQAVIEAVTRTQRSSAWTLAVRPDFISDGGSTGFSSLPVLMGFDFHLSASGPKLIEINTNAGGSLLSIEGARFQNRLPGFDTSCLKPVITPEAARQRVLQSFTDQFVARFGRAPQRIAIVDDAPDTQYLHAEFLLFVDLFREAGIEAVICDAADLEWTGSTLLAGGQPVELVYNRLTDFDFNLPAHAALRAALESDQILITPDPRAHALRANKENLARLTDAAFLEEIGTPEPDRRILLSGIPGTHLVKPEDDALWWANRDRYFFKPVAGFGSRGTYRGSKLTRKVFEQIIAAGYVAQEFVPPALRQSEPGPADGGRRLKFDVRCYVFEGRIDFVAARLYEGQTTNFRTPGGGFAPVYVAPAASSPDDPACQCAPAAT